jgi:hypothetical protein
MRAEASPLRSGLDRRGRPVYKPKVEIGNFNQDEWCLVREAAEKANEKFYGGANLLHFYDSRPSARKKAEKAVCN